VIALTPAMLTFLARDELSGVLARELACIARRQTAIADMAATLAGGLMLIASRQGRSRCQAKAAAANDDLMGERSGRSGRNGICVAVEWLAGRLVRTASSAEKVCAADADGARMLGDPFLVAHALERLTAANTTPAVRVVNPGLAPSFVVTPYVAEPWRPLFVVPPPVRVRLQCLTRQALLPTVTLGWTLERSDPIKW
jgi:heat shock protein HtpX